VPEKLAADRQGLNRFAAESPDFGTPFDGPDGGLEAMIDVGARAMRGKIGTTSSPGFSGDPVFQRQE